MTGRPSKIHTSVTVTDQETGAKSEVPITEAICNLVALGVWPGNAAQAHGVSRQTLHSWRQRGEAALALAHEHAEDGEDLDLDAIPEPDRPFAAFLDALTCAEAKGLAWHELNIRKAASSNREAGGRLSLEFLSRRLRSTYGREVKVEHGGKVNHVVEQEVDAAIDDVIERLAAGDDSDPRAATPAEG